MDGLNNSPSEYVLVLKKERLDLFAGESMLKILVSVTVIPIEILRVRDKVSQPKTR